MNRSGYGEGDCSEEEADEWFRSVADAIRSDAGQAFLRELADALDAMRDKVLIDGHLINAQGDCCALGALCRARGIDTEDMGSDAECVAERLGAPLPLAAEVVDQNDGYRNEIPDARWHRMRRWVEGRIRKEGSE